MSVLLTLVGLMVLAVAMGVVFNMDKMIGQDFAQGLANPGNKVEPAA